MTETEQKRPPYRVKHAVEEKKSPGIIVKNYGVMIFSSLLLACGYAFFITPFNIVPGGIYGVSIALNHIFQVPIGLTALVLNIPLLFFGVKILGARFGFKTVFCLVTTSIFLDGFVAAFHKIPLTEDILVSSVLGGIFIGAAVALVINTGATFGGTDVIARLLSKATGLSVGRLMLGVDAAIVAFGGIVFQSIDMVPYAVISILAISLTVDAVLSGLDTKKAVFIVSEKHPIIREFILNKMDRGGTYLTGKGLYFDEQERMIIFSAMNRSELVTLLNFVKETDPGAFIITVDTKEVFGRGYRRLGY